MPTRFSRARRLVVRSVGGAVLLVLMLGAFACPRAGQYLILDEPLRPADAIVVLAGARVERWLEGVDLYREGKAAAILLSSGIVEPAETRLRAMGIRYPSEVELTRDAMVEMGVPAAAITAFQYTVDNTSEEAVVAHRFARERGWRSLIVVTSKYHTRRAQFAFARQLKGTGISVQVRGSRHDEAQPDRWWKHRADFRFVTWELQKLVAYRLGLGF